MGTPQCSKEGIYGFIQQHPNGVTLDDIRDKYQITPANSDALVFLAQLLADGRVREETRGQKLYCVAVELGATGGKKIDI